MSIQSMQIFQHAIRETRAGEVLMSPEGFAWIVGESILRLAH